MSENPTAHEFVSTSQPPLVAGVPPGVGGAEARLIDSVAVGPTGSGAAGDGIVGRDGVLTTLARFVESGEPKVLLLDGDPGIGKTTLWEWTVRRAADSHRLLSARPLEVEAEMSFAAVADLLAGTAAELEAELPPPQWRALEAALLLADPEGMPPEPQAIAFAFLSALRVLARERPLLVAVDDVQWLDQPSASALTYAARRIGTDAVRMLFTQRASHGSGGV